MSETPTCCYCGGPTVYPHRDPGDDAERGYHEACRPSRGEWRFPGVVRAERAALVAGLDAVTAAFESQLFFLRSSRENWQVIAETNGHILRLRAEAAEAQLRTAREDGARSMATWLATVMPYTIAMLGPTGQQRSVDFGYPVSRDALLAAWRAQDTEATK